MASDRLVSAEHILKAAMEYERRGSTKVLSELETLEPDLLEFLLENLGRLYHQLGKLGLSDADARRAYRRAKKTAAVCVMAMRKAHHDLWQRDQGEPDAREPDARLPDAPPPSPP